MTEKIVEKLRDFDKKITLLEQTGEYLEKRIDDISRNINIMMSTVSVVFGVVAIIGFFSFQSEKTEIRMFRNEIRGEVDKALQQYSALPEIVLKATTGESLHNSVIKSEYIEDGGKIRFFFFISNIGESRTLPIYYVFYTREGLPLNRLSGDEPDFKYASHIGPSKISEDSRILVPGQTRHWRARYTISTGSKPISGPHPVMVKFFYGGEEPAIARFQLDFGNGT